MKHVAPLLIVGAFALSACSGENALAPEVKDVQLRTTAATSVAGSYLVMSNGNSLDDKVIASLSAAGGTISSSHPELGVAFVSSGDPAFASRAAKIKGVGIVTQDMLVQWTPNETPATSVEEQASEPIEMVVGGSDETFYNAQWNVPAIGADRAIAAGHTGAGARVAILDGGIHSTHIDLVANLDAARSRSFIPAAVGALFDWNRDTGTFWHGTHVAGIVAAADNAVGTIGVAPGATLIGVKVLHAGSGQFGWVIAGIMYAATPIAEGGAGADVINMSLGATFLRQANDGSNHLRNALGRAMKYARDRGVIVIVASGNSGRDLDQDSRIMAVPAESPGATTIAATGPEGWIPLGATNFSHPASYTNFGNSLISFSAPGGDFRLPGSAVCSVPRIPSGSVVTRCWVFDMVISTSRGTTNGSYSWAAGTSMAAPAVSGVAALIIGKYGRMHPAELEARLRASATDVNKTGHDGYSGAGFVNAWNAVK